MTKEQIKQTEEKIETLKTMFKKASKNGNYPSMSCIKSKVEGIEFMLNLLGYKIISEDNKAKVVEL